MGIDSGIYKTLLVLHILSAVVGFGAVMLNGLYGNEAKKRRGAEALAITDATVFVSRVAELFIYLVFVFGVLLVVAGDDAWSFGDLWVSLSMGLFVIAVGLSHGLLQPAVKRMRVLMAELVDMGPPPPQGATAGPPPQAVELEQRGRTVAVVGAVLNLTVVVILALMIWKPV
ncbi:MAG TPA: DUF2269 family protein [Acidimicrobiales bacterium]|nr:DUF2269 family protein [Acidimicrobiales bacterium]